MNRIATGLSALGASRRAALFVTLLTTLAYAASLLRERANASAFGTSGELDAYLVASSAIALLAITPSRALYEGLVVSIASSGDARPDVATATARAAVGVGAVVLSAVALAALAAGPPLVRIIAPEMAPSRIAEAQQLALLLAPSILALGLWEIARAILNGLHEFFRSSLVPMVAPLTTFAIVSLLSGSMGIHSLVLGSVGGAAAQAVIGLAIMVRLGVHLRPSSGLVDVRLLARLRGPVAASAILAAIGMLWIASDRFLASGLSEGRISALSYASRINEVISVVAITGIATVAFPRLARTARAATAGEFARVLRTSVLATAAGSLPIAFTLVVFAGPIVHVLFGGGRFDAESERVTTESLIAFVVFLPLTAPAAVIARAVYALGLLRLLVAQSIAVLIAKVGLGLLLRDGYEHIGIAAASGLATLVGGVIVLLAARRAVVSLPQRGPPPAEDLTQHPL